MCTLESHIEGTWVQALWTSLPSSGPWPSITTRGPSPLRASHRLLSAVASAILYACGETCKSSAVFSCSFFGSANHVETPPFLFVHVSVSSVCRLQCGLSMTYTPVPVSPRASCLLAVMFVFGQTCLCLCMYHPCGQCFERYR